MSLFKEGADGLVETAEKLAEELATNKVKTHQIRRIFEQVQYIHEKVADQDFSVVKRDIKLLKPRMAYAARRKPELDPLYDQFNSLVDGINNNEDVKEFYDFMMAIVCYHKYYYKD